MLPNEQAIIKNIKEIFFLEMNGYIPHTKKWVYRKGSTSKGVYINRYIHKNRSQVSNLIMHFEKFKKQESTKHKKK